MELTGEITKANKRTNIFFLVYLSEMKHSFKKKKKVYGVGDWNTLEGDTFPL